MVKPNVVETTEKYDQSGKLIEKIVHEKFVEEKSEYCCTHENYRVPSLTNEYDTSDNTYTKNDVDSMLEQIRIEIDNKISSLKDDVVSTIKQLHGLDI